MGKKTQAEVAVNSGLAKSIICKILNTTGKYDSYQPTLETIWALSIGLKLDWKETNMLMALAFPAMRLWKDFIGRSLDIDGVNQILYEKNLPLWGSKMRREVDADDDSVEAT